MTPPLPDRIAAAIDDLTIAQAACTWAEAGTFTLRSEKEDRAKEARDARSKLVAAIAKVVAERNAANQRTANMLAKLREDLGADLGCGGGFVEILTGIIGLREQRDAAVREKNVTHEFLYAAEVRAKTAEKDCDAATKRADGLRTDLAAAQAKLAEAVQLLSYCRPRVQSYEECNETYCADGQDHEIRKRIEAFLAAAEQGGAQ